MSYRDWSGRPWYERSARPSGAASQSLLPIPDEDMPEVTRREKERKARGFGFNPQPEATVSEPKLWEGDGA